MVPGRFMREPLVLGGGAGFLANRPPRKVFFHSASSDWVVPEEMAASGAREPTV